MARQDVVTLIVVLRGKNARAYPVEQEIGTEVCTLTQSATRAEFYNAAAAGKQVDEEFYVWEADWQGAAKPNADGTAILPSRLEHRGEKFEIVRSFTKDGMRRKIYGKRRV